MEAGAVRRAIISLGQDQGDRWTRSNQARRRAIDPRSSRRPANYR
jgi:hypothetical protein